MGCRRSGQLLLLSPVHKPRLMGRKLAGQPQTHFRGPCPTSVLCSLQIASCPRGGRTSLCLEPKAPRKLFWDKFSGLCGGKPSSLSDSPSSAMPDPVPAGPVSLPGHSGTWVSRGSQLWAAGPSLGPAPMESGVLLALGAPDSGGVCCSHRRRHLGLCPGILVRLTCLHPEPRPVSWRADR